MELSNNGMYIYIYIYIYINVLEYFVTKATKDMIASICDKELSFASFWFKAKFFECHRSNSKIAIDYFQKA